MDNAPGTAKAEASFESRPRKSTSRAMVESAMGRDASQNRPALGLLLASRELRFLALVVVIVLVATSVPYVFAYLSTPPDTQFMGIMLNVPDTAQYFSWMRESGNSILITDRLTPEANQAVFFNLLWFVLGRLAALTSLSLPAIYQLFRLGTAVFSLGVIYFFCAMLTQSIIERRVAFLLITFGSGFGWLLVILKQMTGQLLFPRDVYIAEPNTFLSLLAYPHLVLSAALLLLVLASVMIAEERRQIGFVLLAALAALILGLAHAYDLIIVYAVMGSWILLLWRRDGLEWRLARDFGIVFGLSSPPALYSLYITSNTPVWREVLAQYGNAGVFTPNPFHLIILIGSTLLLAGLTFEGIVHLKKIEKRDLLVRAWFLGGLVLIYIPTDYQVKMLNGWQIAIALLATKGFFTYVLPALGRSASALGGRHFNLQHLAIIALVISVLPTTVYLTAWRFVDLQRHSYPYYLQNDEVQAMRWLESNSHPDQVVLSSLTIGQYLPSTSGNRAFLAHWTGTLRFNEKSRLVEEFFANSTSDGRRADILQQYNVSYLFHGKAERTLGDFDPSTVSYLERAYHSPTTDVFRVQNGGER